MISILWWLIIGVIAGALARLLVPGEDPMSIWMTALLGIAGSFVGGFLGNLIWRPAAGSMFHPGGLIASVIGAIVLLLLYRMLRRRA